MGFYSLAGLIITTWGRVEYYLDWINIYSIGWGQTKDKQLQKSLDPKIRAFIRVFRDNQNLSELKERAEKLFDEINRLKEVRHDFVHGRFFDAVEENGREFARFTYSDQELGEQKKKVYKTLELTQHHLEIHKLSEDVYSFFKDYQEILVAQHKKKAGG